MPNICRLVKLVSRLIVSAGQKQRVGIFAGQRLVDYIKYQVDYTIYESTTKGYKSTNRAMICVYVSRLLTYY